MVGSETSGGNTIPSVGLVCGKPRLARRRHEISRLTTTRWTQASGRSSRDAQHHRSNVLAKDSWATSRASSWSPMRRYASGTTPL
jgi:hypothetical protein